MSLFACLWQPSAPDRVACAASVFATIADAFSPRHECIGDEGVIIDLDGLRRLFGDTRVLGDAIQQTASAHGADIRVAMAATRTAALILARAHSGLIIVDAGNEAQMLAPLPLAILASLMTHSVNEAHEHIAQALHSWGVKTLGELAGLPRAALRARLGPAVLAWQAMARGEDTRPLVPSRPDERFEASMDLEWPIDEQEPLSFVLTRLLEPLAVRLERADRGAAAIHLELRLTTKDIEWRHLELPTPLREVRTLRTLLLLNLESHPPSAAIDRVGVVIDPTPARITQHTLFSRPQPAPEHVSTLLARLSALCGASRIGTPAALDCECPDVFALRPFPVDWSADTGGQAALAPPPHLSPAFRRYRPPVPVRIRLDGNGEPTRLVVDRPGMAGGTVAMSSGPWKTSGAWWANERWHYEEWDVRLTTGLLYRLAHHCDTNRWFIHAVVD